jgi:ethanolamine permease
MGFSMFLECLFATIGTGLAAGGYIAFLINPDQPSRNVATAFAIACALVFFVVQYSGAKQQAVIMVWLTYTAIAALVWFWLGAAPGASLERVFSKPLLPAGWSGVLGAIPYALWWLVIIETVALASEEAHEPQVSIPRGLVLAQITLVVLVLLTWFFACAAAPFAEVGTVDYPLPLVFKAVWGSGWFLTAFSAVAVAGMIVSYNGMIYATSRQSFSLGRAGYLPKALGNVHRTRRTPHVSLAVWTAATIVFIIFGHFYQKATAIAILISTLCAVIWYVLAIVSLMVLRRKEPALLRPYRVPIYPVLPIFVAVLSAIAGYLYVGSNVQVILPTAGLYVAAGIWYCLWARKRVLAVAPEEVAARLAEERTHNEIAKVEATLASGGRRGSQFQGVLSWITGSLLAIGIVSLFWMILRARSVVDGLFSETLELTLVIALWALLFVLVSAVGLMSTGKRYESLD